MAGSVAFVALLASFSMPFGAMAAPLTPAEALSLAMGDAPKGMRGAKAEFKLAETKSVNDKDAVYIFNREGHEGFMVVAADDAVMPLMGYSYTGSLRNEEGEMAPGMEYWLDFLGRQVEYASGRESRRAIPKQARPYRSPISPQLTTKWSQGDPYNFLCSRINGENAVTGCVATAMAQVMNYHEWPEHATGSVSFHSAGKNLSCDFSKITLDWANMADSYDDGYTSAERNAVSRLMMVCGYSVEMSYSVNGSGTTSTRIAPALGNYFGYDKRVSYNSRDAYYLYDWENLIYESLENYGPVILDGQSYQGGHSFVCDGYDKDGYFHINWGWAGLSDGYFLLDVLDPYEQGTGGSASGTGFDFMQDAIVGIRPDREGTSEWTQSLYSTGLILSINDEGKIAQKGMVYNPGPSDFTGVFGLRFRGTDGGENYYNLFSLTELQMGYGFRDITIRLPEDMPAGRYLVDAVYGVGVEVSEEDMLPLPTAVSACREWIIDTTGDTPVMEDQMEYPEFADYTFPTRIEAQKRFGVIGKISMENGGGWYSEMMVLLVNQEMNSVLAYGLGEPLDIAPGESVDFSKEMTLMPVEENLASGNYKICIAVQSGNSYIPLHMPADVYYEAGQNGINLIDAGQESATCEREYYTLTGVRVANAKAGEGEPSLPAGIYLVKTGGKASKVIVK